MNAAPAGAVVVSPTVFQSSVPVSCCAESAAEPGT